MTNIQNFCTHEKMYSYCQSGSIVEYRIYCNKRPDAHKDFLISGGRLLERGGFIIIFVSKEGALNNMTQFGDKLFCFFWKIIFPYRHTNKKQRMVVNPM